MRESQIELSSVELSIGDSVRMDDQILTVLDISEDEVTFRIDAAEEFELDDFEIDNIESDNLESGNVVCHGDEGKHLPPR